MSRFKVVYNKKKENEAIIEKKENGWDNRYNANNKAINPLAKLSNKEKNIGGGLNIVHQENYRKLILLTAEQFLTNLNSKSKLNEIKPKSRGKSNIGTKTPSYENERKNYSSSKNRTNYSNNYNHYYNNQSDLAINPNKLELQGEEKYLTIKQLWDDTGVTDGFRSVFENIAMQLDPIYRNGYYDHEISNLKKMKEKIQKLSNEISAREKTIELLHQIDRHLNQDNDKEKNKKLISDSIKAFQHLRVLSINIINHFMKLRKVSSFAILNGKYDLDKISAGQSLANLHNMDSQLPINFDRNYLIKMKNDTDFLSTSNLNKFFKFANDSDPFLVSLTYGNGNNLNIAVDLNAYFSNDSNGIEKFDKINVPIDENMLNSIKACQYVILEELAYYELNQNNYLKNEITITTGKSTASANKKYSGSNINSAIQKKKNIELKPLNINRSKIGINDSTSKSPVGKHINDKKIQKNNVNNIIDNGSTPENLEHLLLQREANSQNYYNTKSIREPDILSNDHRNKQNNKNENALNDSKSGKKSELVIRETELKKIENLMKKHKKRDSENKESILVIEESKEREVKTNIKIEKLVIDDSKIIPQEEKQKNLINVMNQPSPINKIDNTPDHQTYELIKKMDEELQMSYMEEGNLHTEKVENNQLTGGRKLEIEYQDEKILQEKIIDDNLEMKIKEEKLINDENFDEKLDSVRKMNEIVNEVVKEEKEVIVIKEEELKIEDLKCIFFEGDLSELQREYDLYLEQISEEQKIIFKINTDINSYLRGNFTKIIKILYLKEKSENRTNLAGLATIHYDPHTDIFKLILSSFSTIYMEKYYEIMELLINFLKKSIKFDEIYLELHYGNKDGVFYLNEQINEIIKKKLKFKWITLENTGTERKTKYRLNNNSSSDKDISDFKNTLKIKHSVCLSLQEFDDKIENISDPIENEVNLFPITSLLGEMIYNFDYQVKNQQFKVLNIDKLKKLTKNFVISQASKTKVIQEFVNNSFMETETLLEYPNNPLNQNFNKIQEDEFLFSSFVNIINKFENILTVKHEGNLYNRIQKLDQNPIGTKNAIWLPCFKITQNKLLTHPQLMNDVKISQDDALFSVKELLISSEVNFARDNSSVENRVGLFNVPINTSEEVMINKPFIMAIIQLELLSELNIPVVSVSIIKKEDFIRND